MNDVKYVSGKDSWMATRLIDANGVLTTQYLGLWPTKKEAENAPIPLRWDGKPSF